MNHRPGRVMTGLLLFTILLLSVLGVAAGTNTYGFEGSTEGWTTHYCSVKSSAAHSGTYGLRASGEHTGSSYWGWATSPAQNKPAGNIPQATGWLKLTDNPQYLHPRVEFRQSNGNVACSYDISNASRYQWRQFSFTCPALSADTTWHLRVAADFNTANVSFTYWDDITLSDNAPPPTPTPVPDAAGSVSVTGMVASRLTLALGPAIADFGNTLNPQGVPSDAAGVTAYVSGAQGAYYVRDGASVTVHSNIPWQGWAQAAEQSGTAGMTIAAGSLRWQLGDITSAAAAAAAPPFTLDSDATVFDVASVCSHGAPHIGGVCTYYFTYALRVLWTDAPGTFVTAVTYTVTS